MGISPETYQVSDPKSTQLSKLSILVILKPVAKKSVSHFSPKLWKSIAGRLEPAYFYKINDKNNMFMLSVYEKYVKLLKRFSLPSYCDDLSHLWL